MSDDAFAEVNGIRICYRVEGPEDGAPILLVSGLGQQLTAWPQSFVDDLVGAGLRVVRLDNRDAGRSTRIGTPPPGPLRQLRAKARPDAYDLGDMAADSVALLDHLGIEKVHLVGMSMGGMIVQTIAATHADRVASLTSLISTTGDPKLGQPAWSTKLRLVKPPARTREAAVKSHLEFTQHLAGTGYPMDVATETAYAEQAWDRAVEVADTPGAATARQIQAIQASGDRTCALRGITAPTLVVHGDRDLIVHPTGGRATADAIAGAEHVTIPGMGHHLAAGVLDRLAELVIDHTRQGAPR